jgi:RNA polymerase subunit RPABC4/transcription elongation factor Spt4
VAKWRWPSWAMLGLTAAYILAIVWFISSMQGDAYEAGQRTGMLFWPYLIGMVVLGVVWNNTKPKPCSKCGQPVPFGVATCPSCGASVVATPELASCPRCGQLVYQSTPSCPRCGYVPGQAAESQPPAPPQAGGPPPPAASGE